MQVGSKNVPRYKSKHANYVKLSNLVLELLDTQKQYPNRDCPVLLYIVEDIDLKRLEDFKEIKTKKTLGTLAILEEVGVNYQLSIGGLKKALVMPQLRRTKVEISKVVNDHYTKYDTQCLIIFSVVTTLLSSTLIFNSLTISVRRYARRCARILLLSLLFLFFISLLTTIFEHVTFTY